MFIKFIDYVLKNVKMKINCIVASSISYDYKKIRKNANTYKSILYWI